MENNKEIKKDSWYVKLVRFVHDELMACDNASLGFFTMAIIGVVCGLVAFVVWLTKNSLLFELVCNVCKGVFWTFVVGILMALGLFLIYLFFGFVGYAVHQITTRIYNIKYNLKYKRIHHNKMKWLNDKLKEYDVIYSAKPKSKVFVVDMIPVYKDKLDGLWEIKCYINTREDSDDYNFRYYWYIPETNDSYFVQKQTSK